MKTYKEEIVDLLIPHVGLSQSELHSALTRPQHEGQGDFSFPCFALAKQLRKSPMVIAQELAALVLPSIQNGAFEKVEALSGYLNFTVKKSDYAKSTLSNIVLQGSLYGSSSVGNGKTVVIDYSSPNMGKELAFHHLRGTMLGNALSRLYRLAGYRVVRINHLGDWGTSYGKLIVMFLREGLQESDLATMTIERLNSLYKAFENASKADATLEDQARQAFQKLEAGDLRYKGLWSAFKSITLKELQRLYTMLNVEFDHYTGEAFFIDHIPKIMAEIEAKGLIKQSQGAEIIDLEQFNLTPALLRKTDGATLYITRDIAAAIYRQENYAFDRCLYIVDNGQSLHFQQLNKVLELMGYAWHKNVEHIPFGLVLIKGEEGGWEKGKTRSGQTSLLKDVITGAQEKIMGIIEEKNPDAENKSELGEKIGIGALVFSELKNRRLNDIRFEWEKALSFEGDSGPYVQNAHVRLCSILRKSAERFGRKEADEPIKNGLDGIDFEKYSEPQAQALIQTLSLFQEKVLTAIEINDPIPVAQFALEIAEKTHSFLHVCRALGSDEEKERLLLIDCARLVLKQSLESIGIPAIERM